VYNFNFQLTSHSPPVNYLVTEPALPSVLMLSTY